MEPNLTLTLTVAVLIGCGVYLILERSLTRVLIGLVMMGNGISILFLVSGGPAGESPLIDGTPTDEMSDSLPQAMVLTAIVIMLATTAFVLAMAYRSWQLNAHDDVQDDMEDAAVRRRAISNVVSESFDLSGDEDNDDKPAEEGA